MSLDTIPPYALAYAGVLSLLGIALTLRHRASGIPDFSLVVYHGFGVFSTKVAELFGPSPYLGPLVAFALGCFFGYGAL